MSCIDLHLSQRRFICRVMTFDLLGLPVSSELAVVSDGCGGSVSQRGQRVMTEWDRRLIMTLRNQSTHTHTD